MVRRIRSGRFSHRHGPGIVAHRERTFRPARRAFPDPILLPGDLLMRSSALAGARAYTVVQGPTIAAIGQSSGRTDDERRQAPAVADR